MISHWLCTTEAQVQSRSINLEFIVDRMAFGQVLSKHSGFPLQSKSVYK
jgi:hypothetical protein